MNAPDDNTAAKGLRGWWASPPRPGMQRLINPWEYRHLSGFGVTRIAGGVSRPLRASCASCTASTDGQLSSWFLGR